LAVVEAVDPEQQVREALEVVLRLLHLGLAQHYLFQIVYKFE
jgi:hypothetical protein